MEAQVTLQVRLPAPGTRPAVGLASARQIVRAEGAALLDETFLRAARLLEPLAGRGPGRLGVTGTGKSADIGEKLAGTFSSTGTRSYTLDATRAVHGDLGMVHPEDVVLVLSHSGES